MQRSLNNFLSVPWFSSLLPSNIYGVKEKPEVGNLLKPQILSYFLPTSFALGYINRRDVRCTLVNRLFS